MSFADGRWSLDLVTYLKGRTRELTFDWNKIADDVRNHGRTALGYNDVSFVTPKSCREAFASDYSVENVLQSSGVDPQNIEQPTESANTTSKESSPKVNIDMANMLREYENMSLDDLIEHVRKTEERMKVRREQIFGRVLSSLGGEDGLPSADVGGFISADFEHTRQAYNEGIAAREFEQLKRTAREEEAKEKRRLEEARDELKRRFDVGSKDREGEDPLGQANAATLGSGAKSRYGDSGALRQGDKTDAELDFIDSLPYDPTVVKAFETFMETDEFDQMLTELEMELQAQAPAKSEDEPPSELSEILKVLETAAASSSAQADKKTAPKASGGGISLPQPVGVPQVMPPAPSIPTVSSKTATAASRLSPGRNETLAPVAALKAMPTEPPSGAATRGEGPSRAAGGYGGGYNGGRGGGGRGGGRGGSRGSSGAFTSTAGTEHKDGYSSSDGERDGDDDEGVGSSDSEEDWRAMRHRQKQTAERVQARAGGGSEIAATVAGGAGFWGAYGAPTTRSGPVAVPEYPQSTATDLLDGRHSPSAFDLAAMAERSFHSQGGDEEDSDDEDSDVTDIDDEEPTSTGALPAIVEGEAQRVVEAASPPRSSTMSAAVVESAMKPPPSPTKEAGNVRFDLSEESSARSATEPAPGAAAAGPTTLASPPTGASPPFPAAAVAEEAPLPTPIPLSALAPVIPVPSLSGTLASAALPPPPPTSGLLGAGVGARRPKGKVGGIMNAPRPRKGTASLAGGDAADGVDTTETAASQETSVTLPVPGPAGMDFTPSSAANNAPSPNATTEKGLQSPANAVEIEDSVLPTHTAAERHTAALKRAIALEDLAAPVLAPLPYAYISNKASGSMVEFPTATLPSELRGAGCSVERIVLVDVFVDRLQAAVGGEAEGPTLMALVEWLLTAVVGNYTLLAMQMHSVASQGPVCRLVLETRSCDVTASELQGVAQTTLLRDALRIESTRDLEGSTAASNAEVTVSDVLSVRDSYSAPLLDDLACFATPIANELAILTPAASPGDESVANVVHAKDIAVCAVKSHVLHQQGAQRQGRGVLSELVAQCERQGLRLCGMRLAHLNALELFEYEGFSSIPGYTKPCVAGAESPLRYDAHILPVLCLAFHSSNAQALELEESAAHTVAAVSGFGSGQAGVLSVKASAASSATNTAATILRNVLGPDDPALARKTDPASLRALHGSSKERNLAYPVPHSVDRLLRETTFWFGGRRNEERVSAGAMGAVPQSVSLLVPAPPQYLQLRWTISQQRSDLNAASAAQLAAVQSAVLVAVNESFGVTGLLHALITEPDRRSATASAAEGSGLATQAFRAYYLTHAGAPYVRSCTDAITTKAHALRTPWKVLFTWEFTSTSKLSEEPIPSGSRLLALEMQKRVSEDDCKSHEDVGLGDVVVVTVGKYPVLQPVDEFSSPEVLGRRQHPSPNATAIAPILAKLLTFLPRPCDAHVVALRTNANSSGLVAAIRGYQVVENIDHAVAELQRALSGGSSTSGPSRTLTSGGDKKDSTAGKLADLEARIALSVRVFKSRKALEVLFTEFPLSSVFIDLALRELYTYVPLPGLQRPGLDWQEQAAAVSESITGTRSTQPYATAQYLQALFPPGAFTATGVVLVPWARDDAVMMRDLAKVFTRLEKERFAIVEVKVVGGVSAGLVGALYQENLVEYGALLQEGQEAEMQRILSTVAAGSFVAVLVRRRSALLQLKSVVGPVFSAAVAEAQYPRSVVCLLDSLGNIGISSASAVKTAAEASSSASCRVPRVLPTLSCVSVQSALQELFLYFHASLEALQAALALNHLAYDLHATAADSANIQHVTEQAENSGMLDGVQLRIPSVSRINRTATEAGAAETPTPELQLRSAPEVGSGAESSAASVLPGGGLIRSVDIAGVVVTHALLQEIGMGMLFEALHREGLLLRNAYTTHLTAGAAKQLHQLAGASSLSMKPPLALLTCAPVLVLGLEGPSHSFVRFKSYPLVAKSPVLLWKLTGHTHDGTATEEGLPAAVPQGTVVGEFGVLASSSSRLAKDLYRHCFDALHGVEPAFEFRAL